MNGPQIAWLADGKRLHLNHGPIDLIVEAFGRDAERRRACEAAIARFGTMLTELVAELAELRQPVGAKLRHLAGSTARRMEVAAQKFHPEFITPMAAVAGAVADEMMAAMVAAAPLTRAYVNNGGDIALTLQPGRSFEVGWVVDPVRRYRDRDVAVDGMFSITADLPVRGIATSGWRGRSLSLGIADSVTVLAATGAAADAAATMIANAVNVESPLVVRRRACDVADDTDLGERLVTCDVGPLPPELIDVALDAGAHEAERHRAAERIWAAAIRLQRRTRVIGPIDVAQSPRLRSVDGFV